MPSPFEGKRVLLLYKAASLCFDTPLFELLSLAGRVSDIPDVWGIPGVVRGSQEAPLPCVKSMLSVYGWLCKAQRGRASSALGFISALYWRQTFANKEKKKKKEKNVLRETNFLWQEYYLNFWPIKVPLVSTRIPPANCSACMLLRHCLFCTRLVSKQKKSTTLKINGWLFFFIWL